MPTIAISVGFRLSISLQGTGISVFAALRTSRRDRTQASALAYAGQAGWYITGKAYAWIEGDSSESRQAEKVAREALRLSGDDPRVLAHAGQALTYVAMKVDEGAAILSRAVEIDPNLAIARLWLGGANNFQGKFDDAIEQFELALRLSPSRSANFSFLLRIGIRSFPFEPL